MGIARLGRALLVAGAVAAPAAAVAQDTALPPLDASRVVARRDSLVAVAATGRVGWMRSVVRPTTAGGWRFVETIDVDDAIELTTLVVLDASLVWRQVLQTGEAWDRPLLVAAEAAQTTLPELNAVPLLVIATPWQSGAAGAWRLFDASSSTALTLDVRCEGLELASATAPAAWRVAVRRGATTTRYRVTAEAPWRIVGVATEGVPFQFTLPR